jgi:hypothetical protein
MHRGAEPFQRIAFKIGTAIDQVPPGVALRGGTA